MEGFQPQVNATAGIASATMVPPRATAGEWGRLACRIVIEEPGIETGGVIRLQLPNSWHGGPYHGAKGLHALDVAAANYVAAECSRPGVGLACEVEEGTTDAFVLTPRIGIDGRPHRLVWVVRLTVERGRLEPSDVVDVTFGAGSGPETGFRAALNPHGAERVLVAVDPVGRGSFHVIGADVSPSLQVVPAKPAEVVAVVPSLLEQGEAASLRVAILDAFANAVPDFEGSVRVRLHTGQADFARESQIEPANLGAVRIPFRVTKPGVVRFAVEVPGVGTAVSNPVLCGERAPGLRLYWGDLHSHSDLSYDAIGNTPYEYARDVALLDFYASAEHSEGWPEDAWATIRDRCRRFNHEGEFVTLLAYEATFHSPWGHHNVYFRGDDGPLVSRETGTLLDLWSRLEGHEALTIPHHTGVHWRTIQGLQDPGVSPNPDWSYHDPRFRKLIEVYSLHGQCESYDPSHPLAYENCDYTWAESVRGPHYAVDAWTLGQRLAVIASSDDHASQPGRGEGGLAAVWAPRLTRSDIFDGLANRRTFGTTGSRIVVAISVNGRQGGEEVDWQPSSTVTLDVHATAELAYVELVEIDLEAGSTRVVRHEDASGLDRAWTWRVEPPSRRVAYYARLRQRESYRGRAVMAWSSPVWVRDPSPESC